MAYDAQRGDRFVAMPVWPAERFASPAAIDLTSAAVFGEAAIAQRSTMNQQVSYQGTALAAPKPFDTDGLQPLASEQGQKPSENFVPAARLKPCPDTEYPTSDCRPNGKALVSTLRSYSGLCVGLFLLNATLADGASREYSLQITVLSAETQPIAAEAQVPKDCDLQNYSAYCNESRNPTAQNVMLVRDSEGKSYRIVCVADSRWSKCSPLPVGETLAARTEKHGISVWYLDAKGKERKQLYQLADAGPLPPQSASEPEAAQPPAVATQEAVASKTPCKFSSTPAGAEITLDGRYVGNTPSEIGVSAGTHSVVLSMPGFAQWKREIRVTANSVVNVTAALDKMQP